MELAELNTLFENDGFLEKPTLLYQKGDHAIYWIGVVEETAFRCNVYLIKSGRDVILVDPGNRNFFENVKARVAQITDPANVTGMIICHQDPDVGASMVDWLDFKPDITVFTSPRTNVLLPYFGVKEYDYYDVVEKPEYRCDTGEILRFVEAPFLHFPGAFTTFDLSSGYLFSGDVWAALDIDWALVVEDFDEHVMALDLFHKDYMASNIATRGYVNRIKELPIRAILPQHGSIIIGEDVKKALEYLNNLKCGLDIIYPELGNG